jgi:phage tail sheath protein FI
LGLSDTADGTLSGKGVKNNVVNAYRVASRILTDPISSNINIMAIPGIRDQFVTDFALDRIKDYSMAIYLMDVVNYGVNTAGTSERLFGNSTLKPNVRETAEQFDARTIDNNYAASYFPDVFIEDPVNNRNVKVPGSVAGLSALAYNDRVSYPWFAPAGFNRGALDFVVNTGTRLTAEDRDTLYDNRINPIANFPNGGFVIFGQKTLQMAKSALDRVNVRRMLLEVKRLIVGVANRLLFEQNTPATRSRFVAQTTPLLALVQAQAGIEQFRVICDDTNNGQEDVESNRMNGRIVVVPTRAVEFIAIDFIVTNSGVSFE